MGQAAPSSRSRARRRVADAQVQTSGGGGRGGGRGHLADEFQVMHREGMSQNRGCRLHFQDGNHFCAFE